MKANMSDTSTSLWPMVLPCPYIHSRGILCNIEAFWQKPTEMVKAKY